jgi:16S rRNA processing protein RimM
VEKIACGKFLKPFGVKGELKFQPYFPDDLDISSITSGILRHPAARALPERELLLASARPLNGGIWAVKPDGCNTPEDAKQYTNAELLISRSLISIDEDEYLSDDIIGSKVYDKSGKFIGAVEGVLQTGANDIWQILDPDGKEILLPAVGHVIESVEPGKIIVKIPYGLLD